MSRMKQVATDFDEHIETLDKEALLALIKGLVAMDELRVRQMWLILQRAGVEGYAPAKPTVTYYSKEAAIAQSKRMGGKGRVEQQCLQGGMPFWVDLDTGELWHVELCVLGE